MRVPNNLRSGELGFNMTPMIDVVFLLIIFFLVSSHLAKQEAQMQLPLPVAESGSKQIEEQGRRVTVNVRGDGKLLLAGRAVRPTELAARLGDRITDAGSDLEVRIRSDRSVPYRYVEPIMLACARSGIWNVTFAVYRPEDAR
ncbi:MAG: biopolymer transporter ExbD [Pirellulaceae bacterium]|nr:biopolymer transporter ExbD [Pirellulaceae bacterium]